METPQERKEIIVKELSLKYLPLRHDSRLCSSFIYNELSDDWDVHRVVQECALMHWLFSFTDYPIRCREAYAYFSTIFNSGKHVHDFIKIHIQPYIKAQTIHDYGGIPSEWPWIPTESHVSKTSSQTSLNSQKSDNTNEWLVVDKNSTSST